MRIKQVREIRVEVPLADLLSLVYHAKQSEVFYAEKKNAENKIVRLKAELTRYQAHFEKVNADRKGATGQDGEAAPANDDRGTDAAAQDGRAE